MNVNSADYKSKEVKKSVFNLKQICKDGYVTAVNI